MDIRLKNNEVALVGHVLSPLFLTSPADDALRESFSVWADRSREVESSWPFGSADGVAEAFSLIREGAKDGVTEEVLAEYRRVLQGPAHLEAAPWGSVYSDRDGVVFGNSTVDLMRWMACSGIDFSYGSNVAIDHVGLMLALMAWIADRKPEMLEEFLGEYFFPWVFRYAELLEKAARHPFYQGLAKLLGVTLEGMRVECGIPVASVRLYR